MQFQTLYSPNHNLNPNIFTSSTHLSVPFRQTYPYAQSLFNSKIRNGFIKLGKRVSESAIIMRNSGGLISIRCEESREKDDGFYMRRAVELAKKAIGCTSPNPMVGCVIVKNGEIIGEGFHPKAGQPHAEVFALRDAGDLAENATAYVTLEPCNHFGRTPPCSEALIRAKVKRVVVGMVDPNPIVASKGVERLRQSGIDVTVAVEEELCKNLNEGYIHQMLTGKPFVTLRYSVSINGRLSDQLGVGAKESGGYYSRLLQEYDGIILSSSDLTKNSVFPTSQEPQSKQPLKIIVAKDLKSPLHIPLLSIEAASEVIIFTEKGTIVNTETSQHGIDTVVFDKLNLNSILDYCGRRGLCSVLVDLPRNYEDLEQLIDDGIQNGLVKKVIMEVLPVWKGSEESSIQTLKNFEKEVVKLRRLQSRISNESVLVEGYFP